MLNSCEAPRPLPLDPEDYREWEDFRAEDLFTHDKFLDLIEENHDWLASKPNTTREIYRALIMPMDRGGAYLLQIVVVLNDALWDSGFRTEKTLTCNPTWRWQPPT